MNRQIAEGQWKQLKGKVREKWGRLTDDDVDQVGGSYDRLVGKIQEKYGNAREKVAEEINQFLDRWDEDDRARAKAAQTEDIV